MQSTDSNPIKGRKPFYDRLSFWFRERRNRMLIDGLKQVHLEHGKTIKLLDVGGVETFWQTIPPLPFAEITIVNLAEAFDKPYWFNNERQDIKREVGSALDLSNWYDCDVDVVISNSVIEHVGDWKSVVAAVRELRSVAPHGWIQTPSFYFPIEPHFALPFIHWFGAPIRARLLKIFPHHGAGNLTDAGAARAAVEENNLLSPREFQFLFPDAVILRERFLGMTKSLIATWGGMTPQHKRF